MKKLNPNYFGASKEFEQKLHDNRNDSGSFATFHSTAVAATLSLVPQNRPDILQCVQCLERDSANGVVNQNTIKQQSAVAAYHEQEAANYSTVSRPEWQMLADKHAAAATMHRSAIVKLQNQLASSQPT